MDRFSLQIGTNNNDVCVTSLNHLQEILHVLYGANHYEVLVWLRVSSGINIKIFIGVRSSFSVFHTELATCSIMPAISQCKVL
jgi:hypothetical protein